MSTNKTFMAMQHTEEEWARKRNELIAKKEAAVAEHGQGSGEAMEYSKKIKSLRYPFSAGETKALKAWENREGEDIVFEDFLFADQVYDFLETLRRAGVESFVFADNSTAVMETLHTFASHGWVFDELCKVEKEYPWGSKDTKPAIRLKYKGENK